MSSHSHLFGNLLPPVDGEGAIMGRKSQLNWSRFTTNFCVPAENEFQCNCTLATLLSRRQFEKKMVPLIVLEFPYP